MLRAVRSERGQGLLEIALYVAGGVSLVGAGVFGVNYMNHRNDNHLSPAEQAYVQSVATQQAVAYIAAIATQQAAAPTQAPPSVPAAPRVASSAPTLVPPPPLATVPSSPSLAAVAPSPVPTSPQAPSATSHATECLKGAADLEELAWAYEGQPVFVKMVADFYARCGDWMTATGWTLHDDCAGPANPIPHPGCALAETTGVSSPSTPPLPTATPQPTLSAPGSLNCWSSVVGGSSSLHCSGQNGNFDCYGSDGHFSCSGFGHDFTCYGSSIADAYGFTTSTLNCSGPGIAFTCRGAGGSFIDCT